MGTMPTIDVSIDKNLINKTPQKPQTETFKWYIVQNAGLKTRTPRSFVLVVEQLCKQGPLLRVGMNAEKLSGNALGFLMGGQS